MRINSRNADAMGPEDGSAMGVKTTWFWNRLSSLGCLALLMLIGGEMNAQVNVVTVHNDIGRTGQNLNETLLTPTSVTGGFRKLFSQTVSGGIFAQPLYVSQVTIPGNGVHNVVYVATQNDYVYAFDADTNGGTASGPLWRTSLLPNASYSADHGVLGTPVINPATNTLYVVSGDTLNSVDTYRLHALDITTGAEKFGGPVPISGSQAGSGSGSTGGVLTFDASVQLQRPGLLLLNGVVYVAFGSIGDIGPWHGWIFSYNASTLKQIDEFCSSPNGSGAGFWMGGSGLAAEVNNPAKPYGRMFVTTGNGSYATASGSYGMTVLNLDLTGGQMTIQDEFTPFNEALLDGEDGDLGSGGPVLLPAQKLASGATLNPLVEMGKSGMIYLLNRSNLGGFNTAADNVAQEVQTPEAGSHNWGSGVWGTEAYWNNNIYIGGTYAGVTDGIASYSLIDGVVSTTQTGQTDNEYSYPGPTPSISANGNTNGILWAINSREYNLGSEVLVAYDATDLSTILYSSNSNLPADNPGGAIQYEIPTIANGKVYVGALGQLSIYGLSSLAKTVAAPVFNPPGATFTGSQVVTITDSTPGASIYYTTSGSTPTTASNLYNGPITVKANETINAIASATGYLQGAPVSASFYSTANAANPVLSLAAGSYVGTQTVTITDRSANPTIYYTVDGTTPTTGSTVYTKPITIPVSETVEAIATSPGLLSSSMVAASYSITPAYAISFTGGFAQAQILKQMQFNGSTDLDDFRLQLTNGGVHEAGTAFFMTPVNVQAFTTDFTFQLSNPVGDGITFTFQGDYPTALGAVDSGLGFAGIPKSVGIKFDLRNDAGQGSDSTGIYYNGLSPTVPSIDLTNTPINLHSGDDMNVHMTYDGTVLNMTITDAVTLASWSNAFTVNIPYYVGGNSAYVGFTGSTGGVTASQKVTYWTYQTGQPPLPNYPAGFDATGLVFNGNVAVNGTNLELTNGKASQLSSVYYATPVGIDTFTSDFYFRVNKGYTATAGDGFTFILQDAGPNALGTTGGGLGSATIPNSIAIKFDLYNNSGEGTDSTGVYVNGASPTVPSINLSSTGIIFNSGDTIHVHITYDGTTLIWAINIGAVGASEKVKLNIPNAIGSNVAYVGFTAASSDGTSVQNILDWSFNNQ